MVRVLCASTNITTGVKQAIYIHNNEKDQQKMKNSKRNSVLVHFPFSLRSLFIHTISFANFLN
jgi:hypothetical protein